MKDLLEIINRRIAASATIHIQSGKCKNVTDTFCDVEREGDLPDLLEVRLNAAKETTDFVTIVPKEGSDVLIGLMDGQRAEAFVIQCSEVEKVICQTGASTLEFLDGKITINGGDNDGLVLIKPLVQQLNALEQDVNNLKTSLQTAMATPVPEPGNGAASAFQASMKLAIASWYSQQLQPTQQTDIENDKILQ